MAEVVLNEKNFEAEVLKSDKPVLVDFWATWCGPCRMMAPVVASIAEKYEGKVKVGKVNTDDEQNLAMQFGIDAIPCFILFKGGKAVDKKVGFMSEEELTSMF